MPAVGGGAACRAPKARDRLRAGKGTQHACNHPSCQCLGSDGPPNPGSSSPARAPASIRGPSPASSAPPGVRPLRALAPPGHGHAVLSSAAAEVFPQAPV